MVKPFAMAQMLPKEARLAISIVAVIKILSTAYRLISTMLVCHFRLCPRSIKEKGFATQRQARGSSHFEEAWTEQERRGVCGNQEQRLLERTRCIGVAQEKVRNSA
jgi:hypothetical protein